MTLERIRQAFAVVTQGRSRTRESCMYGSVSSAQELLIDGVRIVMQILVDEFGDRMTRDTREDIQQWYDRCYEMLGEGQREQVSDRTDSDSRPHEFG